MICCKDSALSSHTCVDMTQVNWETLTTSSLLILMAETKENAIGIEIERERERERGERLNNKEGFSDSSKECEQNSSI